MGWTSGYSTPDGQKRAWGNGDGRFVYPPVEAADGNPGRPILEGPVDSIRWEMLRDGIEDYEYLAILKHLIADEGRQARCGPEDAIRRPAGSARGDHEGHDHLHEGPGPHRAAARPRRAGHRGVGPSLSVRLPSE